MSIYEIASREPDEYDDQDSHPDNSIIRIDHTGNEITEHEDYVPRSYDSCGVLTSSVGDPSDEEMGSFLGICAVGSDLIASRDHDLISQKVEHSLNLVQDYFDDDEDFDFDDDDDDDDNDGDDDEGDDDGPPVLNSYPQYYLESDVEYGNRLPSKWISSSDSEGVKQLPMIRDPYPDR